MQHKINVIFTRRSLELNGSLRFNDSLSLCNRGHWHVLSDLLKSDTDHGVIIIINSVL